MTVEEVKEKFRENSSNVLEEKRIEELIEKVFGLDKLEDMGELFK